MASLQLKYGDLALDVVEAWSESLDWPIQAYAIPGAWAGCAIARRIAPRRISLRGFVGQNISDPTIAHRDNLSNLMARINDAVQESKRYTSALWRLWFFDDRYILCRPISFTFDHIEGIAWASRFSAEFVAPDPRWYQNSTSNANWTVGGTSVWATLGISSPGDAPCEPRFHFSMTGASQFAFTNYYKNRLYNAALREADPGSSGVPLGWSLSDANGSTNLHMYGPYGDSEYGLAYFISKQIGSAGSNFIYQDAFMTEPNSVWSFSARVATQNITADQNFHIELQFLSKNKVSLATHVSSLITTSSTEQTLAITNKTAPSGTQYIRAAIVFYDAVGTAPGQGFFRWAQLERAATNSIFEYRERAVMQFNNTQLPNNTEMWIDMQKGKAYYIGTSGPFVFSSQINLLNSLSSGNFWSIEPGANELVLETYRATSQVLNMKWENTWWAK